MVKPEKPAANGFVRYARKIYNPIGFSKGYNFVLFFIFGGAFLGFCLSRTPYMNINGKFCVRQTSQVGPNDFDPGASPGECYYYNNFQTQKIGIRLHLYCVIPAGILAVFQFVPVIRHKLLLLHRLNGYVTILLALLGSIGGLMIGRHAFGGTLDTQTGTAVLFIMVTISLSLAYINIKRLQIDQHRAWMLRAWAYLATIVTVRLTLKAISRIVTLKGTYHTVEPCDKLQYSLFNNPDILAVLYPACQPFINGTDPFGVALVKSDLYALEPAKVASALGIGFGTCIWLSILIHGVAVELYLNFTPKEAQRLRNVSYQRQLEAGYKRPGSSGIVLEHFADAEPWQPSPATVEKSSVVHHNVAMPVPVAAPASISSSSTLDDENQKVQGVRPGVKTVDSASGSDV